MTTSIELRDLTEINVPEQLNYIGVFLFMGCNLSCSYCINDPQLTNCRKELFPLHDVFLSAEEFAIGLNRIPARKDLPITLQGGEPSLYDSSKGLGVLLSILHHKVDLLTNLVIKPELLGKSIAPYARLLTRSAPYPSIRVSYHPSEMKRLWGEDAPHELVRRCQLLANYGLTVLPNKRDSDVGIYMVDFPDHDGEAEMVSAAKGKVPFEKKEFLGVHNGTLYGTYLYPFSTDMYNRNPHAAPVSCECRTTELLIDPMGFVWRCHFYLYKAWSDNTLYIPFQRLRDVHFKFQKNRKSIFSLPHETPIGHILDPDFSFDQVFCFQPCDNYGRCIGCDTKVKNNRHQSLDDSNIPHTSVMIQNINMPENLIKQLNHPDPLVRMVDHD